MIAYLLAGIFGSPKPPTPPPAQTPGSNVTVTMCHAQLDPPPLRIAYVNNAAVAAIEVDFIVRSNAGTIASVVDRGRFEPGKPVNHVFALPPDASPLGMSSARCVVVKIAYADGTTWTNPNP